MAKLSTSIALHCLSLAISGKVVGSTALVASSRARSPSETAAGRESTPESTSADGCSTAHTWDRSSASWARARALEVVRIFPFIQQYHHIPPSDLVDHSCSSDRLYQLRSGEGLGSRPGRDLSPGNGSTAWPRLFVAEGSRWTRGLR